VSCGKSVEKSVVPVAGETWYRARLDLEGVAAIPDIEVTMIELRQDGQKVPLHEVLVLTDVSGDD
jgi:hypothetical protein